jgi:2-methylcitrate dehydratase PrpD
LATFAAELRADDIPSEVQEKILLHTLDQLGAQVIGSRQRWNGIVRDYALEESPDGPATIVGADRRGRAEWAAFSNATAGHGFETDDYHPEALSHPGCVVVPTVMALGEVLDADGIEPFVALVIGFEAVVRLGLAVQPSMIYDRGFHETCASGVFGAAVAAARLLGFDSDATASALGVAGSHSSGTTEYSQSGGEVKRMHAGLAAMGALRAGALVSAGFEGPRAILEGRRGFYQAFAETVRPERVTDGLGEHWELLDTGIKPFPCCSLLHAPIQAIRLMAEDDGLTPDAVEEIVVGCDHLSLVHVGGVGPRPADMTGAQFSAEFTVGMTLATGGADAEHYLAAAAGGFSDPATLAVADRVRLELWDKADRAFPDAFLARVTARLKDGRVLQRDEYARGSGERQLDREEIRRKFRGNVTDVLGAPGAARVETAVDDLANGGSVRNVMEQLRLSAPEDALATISRGMEEGDT